MCDKKWKGKIMVGFVYLAIIILGWIFGILNEVKRRQGFFKENCNKKVKKITIACLIISMLIIIIFTIMGCIYFMNMSTEIGEDLNSGVDLSNPGAGFVAIAKFFGFLLVLFLSGIIVPIIIILSLLASIIVWNTILTILSIICYCKKWIMPNGLWIMLLVLNTIQTLGYGVIIIYSIQQLLNI